MKAKQTTLSLAAAFAISPLCLFGQVTEEKTEIERNPDGSVTKTTTTTTFTPDLRTKVVGYFEPFGTERYGLPPEIVEEVRVERIPATWKTTRIEPGLVIEEKHREFLVKAPPKLITYLPEQTSYGYYLAGSNVVVVDSDYRVLDSLRIPTINFEVETRD